MCGRFTLITSGSDLAGMFGIDEIPAIAPRYNIAPSEPVVAVRISPETGAREFAVFKFGLVLSRSSSNRVINARAETVSDLPSFHAAFRSRRCLVPADGFYEWLKLPGRRQPYYVRLRDGGPFAIAALWEGPAAKDGSAGMCALITTAANETVRPLHDRMPAIIAPEGFSQWLDPSVRAEGNLLPLLQPFPAPGMAVFPVGSQVNNPLVDDPSCIKPLQ